MAGSQLYIGTPNGIVLCLDDCGGGEFRGRLYHHYSAGPAVFSNIIQMLRLMEDLFDRLDFPREGANRRSFRDSISNSTKSGGKTRNFPNSEKEMRKVMSDNELLNQHGYQETFIVRVQYRQNSTWQGRITWADQNKTLTFRSVWEMIHLMESAMTEEMQPGEIPPTDCWDQTEKES